MGLAETLAAALRPVASSLVTSFADATVSIYDLAAQSRDEDNTPVAGTETRHSALRGKLTLVSVAEARQRWGESPDDRAVLMLTGDLGELRGLYVKVTEGFRTGTVWEVMDAPWDNVAQLYSLALALRPQTVIE